VEQYSFGNHFGEDLTETTQNAARKGRVLLSLHFVPNKAKWVSMIKRILKLGVIVVLLGVIGGAGFIVYEMTTGRIDTSHDIEVQLTDELRAQFDQQLADAKAKIDSEKDKDRDWNAYVDAGWAARGLGRFGEAEAYYKAYLEYSPLDRRVLTNYAALLIETKRYKQAEEIYAKLMEESFEVEDLRDWIEVVKIQNEDGSRDNDIVNTLERAVATFGQTPFLMQTLGDWYEAHGECALAIDHYKVLESIVDPAQRDLVRSDIERIRTSCTNK
jgi:tetratricopeptide (TPR) repeat protein